MNRILLFLPISVSLFLTACGGLNKDRLRAYVEDEANGLVQKQSYPEADYRLMYRPNDLAYLYEVTDGSWSSDGLARYREENKNTSLFILEITLTDSVKQSTIDFNPIKATYQNALNADFFQLADGNEETPCLIYHCETQGKGHYKINLLFGKGLSQLQNDWMIRFYDPVTGISPEFTFKKEQLTQIPSLTI